MAEIQQSTFIIAREDRAEDPKTIVSEGLRIGRLPEADVWLNHPKVSRLHAGISEIEGYFFLINLSASSATTLNGRVVPFNEAEALTAGDEIQIGPYFVRIASIDQANEVLHIQVAMEFAFDVGDREPAHKIEEHRKQIPEAARVTAQLKIPTGGLDDSHAKPVKTGDLPKVTNVLKVFWDKRTREKAGRPSPLHPRTPPRLGKIRFNWVPTRDLIRPWPLTIFVWAIIAVGTFSAIAAFAHKETFAPEAISDPHTRNDFSLTPQIANRPNGGDCTSCHALGISVTNREKMHSNCANCHQTESFVATVIPAHRAAGINCTNCHAEHRGEEFRPLNAALESCAKCHNDQNKKTYNGRSVHTPHGGTFGYPVTDRKWIWKGLDAEELDQTPQVKVFLQKNKVEPTQQQAWRNAQFHGIHLNHIRVVPGIEGIVDEDGNTVLSCSSCHQTGYIGANVDREYPRTTCGKCHNSEVFHEPSTAPVKSQVPSCTSCHVQHVRDTHWAASLRTSGSNIKQ
jgi:hypothetical protein